MSIHAGAFILFACVHKSLNSNRFVLLGNRIEIERRTQPKTPATGPALHSAGPAPSPHGPAGSSAQPSTSLPLGPRRTRDTRSRASAGPPPASLCAHDPAACVALSLTAPRARLSDPHATSRNGRPSHRRDARAASAPWARTPRPQPPYKWDPRPLLHLIFTPKPPPCSAAPH